MREGEGEIEREKGRLREVEIERERDREKTVTIVSIPTVWSHSSPCVHGGGHGNEINTTQTKGPAVMDTPGCFSLSTSYCNSTSSNTMS